jgi:hypothetical protein
MRLRRLAAAVIGTACLALASAVGGASPAEAAPRTAHATATGDAKTACLYSHNSIAELRAIGRRIGSPFSCAAVYNTVPTWKDWTDPWFVHSPIADYQWPAWVAEAPDTRRMVIGQSMIPTSGMPSDWRRRGAAGQYDRHIRALGRNLVRAGLGRSVIRLGYEANGDWGVDNVGRTGRDFAQWRRYWARFARVLNAVPGARFTMDWNLNNAYRDIPLSSIYPGDRVVDVIGIDVYDSAGPRLPAPSRARWRAIASQPGGLDEIIAFARRHGKPLSLPEWGLITRARRGAGDDPFFVAGIASVVRANRVAYQAYFNNDRLAGCVEIQKSRRSFAVYSLAFGAAAHRLGAAGRRTARRS